MNLLIRLFALLILAASAGMGVLSALGLSVALFGFGATEIALGDPPDRTSLQFFIFIATSCLMIPLCAMGTYLLVILPVFSATGIKERGSCRWLINIISRVSANDPNGPNGIPPRTEIQ